MQIHAYLSFKGDCEAAFTAYAKCLGGQIGELFRYGGTPMAGDVPAGWENKIMHGSVKVAGHTLMGADMPAEQYEVPQGFSVSLHLTNVAEAERVFGELSAGGRIVIPLEKTFWAARFGMFVDRFGIPWTINCEAAE